jgi:hypothetical protein
MVPAAFTSLTARPTIIWHHIGIPDEHQLTLRQADRASPEGRDWPEDGQARTDFATIESNLEFIMGQLARVPTRTQLARYSLLVMVGTACLVQTLAFLFR